MCIRDSCSRCTRRDPCRRHSTCASACVRNHSRRSTSFLWPQGPRVIEPTGGRVPPAAFLHTSLEGNLLAVEVSGGVHGRAGRHGAWTTAVPAAHELDLVGDDLELGALLALRVLPLAPAEFALDGHLGTLAEEARQRLAAGAEDGDVHEVRGVLPLTGALVLATVIHGHAELEHG